MTPIRRLPDDSAPLSVINIAVTRGGKEVHSMGEGGVRKTKSQFTKKIHQKNPKEPTV